jgi:hypothetical protein
MSVTLDPVIVALGPIGLNGLTVLKDSKQDRKIVRVKVLTEILILVMENALVLLVNLVLV